MKYFCLYQKPKEKTKNVFFFYDFAYKNCLSWHVRENKQYARKTIKSYEYKSKHMVFIRQIFEIPL